MPGHDRCRAPASRSPLLEQILHYAAMMTETGEVDRPTPETIPRYNWAYELEWYRRNFHWYHFMTLVFPLVPIYIGVQHVSLDENTAIMALIYAIIGGFSLTIGYHRLWSHRSFQACIGIQVLLAVLGAAQNQWSIIWWVRHHRAHHQYTDTDRDPYNAKRGLLFSHIGWLLGLNQAAWGPVDVSDLENDPVVVWQQRLYYPIVVLVGFILPAAVAHYGWNDWNGGMLYGGLIRITVVQQVTFLNNSVAHAPWAGSRPYGTNSTARNVSLLAIFTLGEANHNFHHTFPIDYRNGIEWYEPDFSRWLIWLWWKLGFASGLKTVSPLEIQRARHRQYLDHTEDIRKLSQLPQLTWENYINQANQGHCLVAIDGVVHDVTGYMDDHPGGRDLIQGAIGKDATALYHGHHPHSIRAGTVLAKLRVYVTDRQKRDN